MNGDALKFPALLGELQVGPLFRASRGRSLSAQPMTRHLVWSMVKRRAKDAGFDPTKISSHTFRATGITNYMEHGGSLETAARIAGHASVKTTQLYARNVERIDKDEINRIRI